MVDNYFKVISGGSTRFFFFNSAVAEEVNKALEAAESQVLALKLYYRDVGLVVWKRANSVPSHILAVGETLDRPTSNHEFN